MKKELTINAVERIKTDQGVYLYAVHLGPLMLTLNEWQEFVTIEDNQKVRAELGK